MIPPEYIEELTRRTDLTELIGSYVQLKRKGRLYGGLCPFHSEKSPSFYVYPDTQSFYCFGCGAGGDAITFTKKINSIDYPEAVKLLAARAGMPEPEEDDKTGRMRSRILSMNKEAARFFHACLNSTVEEARQARAYWRRRGLDDKTIVRFGLGYAPNDGQALYQFLRDKGYNQQELDASGLFKRSQSGRIYCLFWKRVMTPIFDLRGNIIAFGGRVLDDSKPKYVNSPETLVYHKSDTVFALQIAKKSASRRFVLCEGYMDVISMQQAGIDTAVCACGTALTPDQVKLISQYAEEVILSYDSDEAGQKATLRSLELFRNSPVKVGVLQIPGAKDPDEYIKKYGAERFKALLDGVGNALDFRLKRLRDKYDLSQDGQRLEYIKEAVDMLAERSNPTEQEVYAGRLAEETNVSKTAIMTQLETAVKRAGYKRRQERSRARLKEGEMNQINKYKKDVDGVTGKNTPNVTQYGLVHLDGTQATTYARIRKLSGDDFKRASRQRIVLQAMLEKAKKANPATLVKICNSMVDDISTTLSLDQMVSLAKDVTKYKISSTTGFPTDLTTKNMPRCGDTVIPADLVTNVKKLHEYMFDDAAYTPSQTVQAISETIVNTTGITADSAKINTSDYNETVGATGTDEIQKGSETTGGTNVQ